MEEPPRKFKETDHVRVLPRHLKGLSFGSEGRVSGQVLVNGRWRFRVSCPDPEGGMAFDKWFPEDWLELCLESDAASRHGTRDDGAPGV